MKIGTVKKQPNERRRYGIDYKEALDTGDLIQGVVTTSVEPTGLTVSATTDFETSVRITCESGTTGVTYKVTLQVTTTNSNEIIEDELYVKVKEI